MSARPVYVGIDVSKHRLDGSCRPGEGCQVGNDPDYQYPARYLGVDAARQQIPPDPGTRPYDPEERAALADRTVKDLEAENSPFPFVRTQAVTQRARIALERTHHQPARSTRDDRPHSRPRRGRGHRQEAERER